MNKTVLLGSAVAMMLVAVGCSGEPGGLACGPGTVEQGGVCVAAVVDGGLGDSGSDGPTADGAAGDGASGQDGEAEDAADEPDAEPVDPSGACPKDLPGPKLIEVSTPEGAKYCIDSTEVTFAQYVEFAKAKGSDVSGQNAECEFNTAWWGDQGTADCTHLLGSLAVGCVDFCDAYAYCKWAGKHLCGKVGGGPLSVADLTDPNKSEWYNACSARGTLKYPYGDEYDVQACYTERNVWEGPPVEGVPAAETCHGPSAPFDAIFDLSGNVSEWIDARTAGQFYVVAGGGWHAENFVCAGTLEPAPSSAAKSSSTGIRCCANLP